MSGSLNIKVCGMLDPGNLEQVCVLGPDLVGYIFYPGSKRFLGHTPDPALFSLPGEGIEKVGVFVDEEIGRVMHSFESCGLDLVQLHGKETPSYCRTLSDEGIPVIKALDPGMDSELMESYRDGVQFLLFDTPGKEHGGTGRKFDWSLLKGMPCPLPFFLSGGIAPGDAEAIKAVDHHGLRGVDVNSRFELAPGRKDVRLLEKFINEIRK